MRIDFRALARALPRAGWRFAVMLGGLAVAAAAGAAPVTYSGTVVTDLSFKGAAYHNALLTLSISADTSNIQPVLDPATGLPIKSTNCAGNNNPAYAGSLPNGPYFFYLAGGKASLRIESAGRVHSASFAPGQLFVAFDLCNGGIGFGAFIGPDGIEPAYPMGFLGGTAMSFAFNAPDPLHTSVNLSGYVWSCVGIAENIVNSALGCATPDPYPLHTDGGDLVVYMPYQIPDDWHGRSLNRGTFSVVIKP